MDKFKNKTALLADDEPEVLSHLAKQLTDMGFHVLTANSQKEAEEIFAKQKPDVAILDLMMEKQDSGFILAYEIKKQYPTLPVVLLAEVTSDTRVLFSLETEGEQNWIKADRYLEKGLRPEQLAHVLRELL
ncbi:MAG: response regulator [Bacteroidales bacterium]|jgi:CheY-like chemotaxis protein|nr:response regulator [Bacteroidales bacterium]